MYANQFCACSFTGFGDFAPFVCLQKQPKFPFRLWGSKIESTQKIHASKGRCEIHANQYGGHGLASF